MFKFVAILAFSTLALALPKPSVIAPAPLLAPAVVTAQSSQVIARNYNALAAPLVRAAPIIAPAAPVIAPAPFVRAAAPVVAPAPLVRATSVVAPAPYAAVAPAPYAAFAPAPYVASPYAAPFVL